MASGSSFDSRSVEKQRSTRLASRKRISSSTASGGGTIPSPSKRPSVQTPMPSQGIMVLKGSTKPRRFWKMVSSGSMLATSASSTSRACP